MSVLENVTLAPIKVLKMEQAEADDRAMVLLKRIGLEAKANEYPDRLSGGQQQRVAIVGPWPWSRSSCCSMRSPPPSIPNWCRRC